MIMPMDRGPGVDWKQAAAHERGARTQRLLVGLALVGVVALGFLALLRPYLIVLSAGRSFGEAELNRLSRLSYPKADPESEEPGELYLSGKVLVIRRGLTSREMGGKFGDEVAFPAAVDEQHADLPGDLRASSPSDVGTVIVLRSSLRKWTQEEIGRTPVYDKKGKLMGHWVTILKSYDPKTTFTGWIYDLKRQVLVGEFALAAEGTTPPRLAELITNLPRR
ncbi:MAG: hypothetical protein AB7N76_20445 [Planctomycetota bacterium]